MLWVGTNIWSIFVTLNYFQFESVDPKRIRLAISSLKNIDSASVLDVLEKILIR